MSIDGSINKQNVVYPHSGILLSPRKEGNSDTCYNVNEPWGCYAKWNKPVTKRHTGWFYLYEVLKSSGNHKDRIYNGSCQGLEENGELVFNTCRVSVLQDELWG